MNKEELLARLNGFEWNDFECKRAQRGVPEDAYRTVSAFANTRGGWLVFGVSERDGRLEVTGVETPDAVQNDFLSTLRARQKLSRAVAAEPHKHEVDGRVVLIFHIPEALRADKPVYLRGDPRQSFIRRGAGDEQCTQGELERFLRDASQDRFDAQVVLDYPVDACFDLGTVRWYQVQFARRHPEHAEIPDPIEFLLNWNYVVERSGVIQPTRAGVLLFGSGQYVRQLLPRPVLDYQRIDTSFEQWSAEERWHDRYVFEENILQTWQGLVARYMRIAERPFSIDPTTLRRQDDPPAYVAFREAAINLLIHQDYGDYGRKASIRLFTDRTIFWNPGDAFASEAELLEPTEKEVRNPSIVNAFRRIGLSDQAGTGIRAIFRNWHELGRVPPLLTNNKSSKDFELVLVEQPLITDGMKRFRQDVGVKLSAEEADVLALALNRSDGEAISLTDIRSLGVSTARRAKEIAAFLVSQQLLEPVGDTKFRPRESLRRLFHDTSLQIDLSVPQVTPQVAPQVTPQVQALLEAISGEMTRQELMEALTLKDRKNFGESYLTPALEAGLLEMTNPEKPRSSKQRYRLTERGNATIRSAGR